MAGPIPTREEILPARIPETAKRIARSPNEENWTKESSTTLDPDSSLNPLPDQSFVQIMFKGRTRVVDNHNHILFSNLSDMTAAALAKGIGEYSVTEHISQFKVARDNVDFGSVHATGRVFKDFDEYKAEFAKVDKLRSILVRRGLEVDYSPRYENRVADLLNEEQWDILICSIHEFQDGTPIEAKPSNLREAEVHWRKYFRLQQTALESDVIDFQVLAHPVRMSRVASLVPAEFDTLLLDLARTARKKEKMLELNGHDLELVPDLVRRLARACSTGQCKVTVGSDAHYSYEVFRNIPQAMKLVEEFKLELG